ncbi:MAG TPA: C39 family peptidase [Methanobacteriales archaeon]|jgi:Predicted double-glycine peptidase|nr:C39 family peptidase [Methanobacteriales archaeon]
MTAAGAAENFTVDAAACTDNSTVVEVQDGDVGAPDDATVDSEGVILQTRNYTCGPAALATVFQKLGISTTEDELAELAGTTEDGTTMQGLLEAAKAKGVNAVSMKLGISELKENMIVYTMVDGVGHYTIIGEITSDAIKFADPTAGNIKLTLQDSREMYTGYALVINHNTTRTKNQTDTDNNPAVDSATQSSAENKTLSREEMQNIKGKAVHRKKFRYRVGWPRTGMRFCWACLMG